MSNSCFVLCVKRCGLFFLSYRKNHDLMRIHSFIKNPPTEDLLCASPLLGSFAASFNGRDRQEGKKEEVLLLGAGYRVHRGTKEGPGPPLSGGKYPDGGDSEVDTEGQIRRSGARSQGGDGEVEGCFRPKK